MPSVPIVVESTDPKPKPSKPDNGLFELLDKSKDGTLSINEVFQIFNNGDKDRSYTLRPEELFFTILSYEEVICRFYERRIDRKMLK